MSPSMNLARKYDLQRGTDYLRATPDSEGDPWDLAVLQGRFVELSGRSECATLSMAASLIRQAQLQREVAVWIGTREAPFYPPDMAASGIDLEQLPVVLLSCAKAIARAADLLLRSGAFALVVLDLGARVDLPIAMQTRLAGLAKQESALLLCLTEKSRKVPSLSSLVSLRAEVQRRPLGEGRYSCEVQIIKDKRRGVGLRGMGWKHSELHCGPAGLR